MLNQRRKEKSEMKTTATTVCDECVQWCARKNDGTRTQLCGWKVNKTNSMHLNQKQKLRGWMKEEKNKEAKKSNWRKKKQKKNTKKWKELIKLIYLISFNDSIYKYIYVRNIFIFIFFFFLELSDSILSHSIIALNERFLFS